MDDRSPPRPDARGSRGWLGAGYAGLAGFFALEALLRRPGGSASLRASAQDSGTTRDVVLAYAVASDLPVLRRWLPGRLPRVAGPVGLSLQAAGLMLRGWSMSTLGTSYTRTLRVDADTQHLVDQGPYRWVRHPGYLGSLLVWVGFGCTSRNISALLGITALLGVVYTRRIAAEEALLQSDLPGYATYRASTRKLIPHVW